MVFILKINKNVCLKYGCFLVVCFNLFKFFRIVFSFIFYLEFLKGEYLRYMKGYIWRVDNLIIIGCEKKNWFFNGYFMLE